MHGDAGVGRIFPLRELEQIARERGALTAYVDEGADSVPEVPAVMSRQFADRGARFKELDEVPAARRERRHEAESAAPAASDPEPEGGPSAGSMAVAGAGPAGLGPARGRVPSGTRSYVIGTADSRPLPLTRVTLRIPISPLNRPSPFD
ncbi:hypothetical protein GCM10010294_43700 [Streptomyces griseoloalbus]|uniref:hypothetical protein n=1 Tax=Streptomyces griseoloalbus TaxID=67303 RepID=UPI0018770CC6|nr:hypothetical protein GCM10010294_43700 [Streptomyces griseoloalbus]